MIFTQRWVTYQLVDTHTFINFIFLLFSVHFLYKIFHKMLPKSPIEGQYSPKQPKDSLKVGLCVVTAPRVMKNTCDNTLMSITLRCTPSLNSLPHEVYPSMGRLHMGKLVGWSQTFINHCMYGIFDPFLPKINSKCPKSDEFRGWVGGDGWVRNFGSIVPRKNGRPSNFPLEY